MHTVSQSPDDPQTEQVPPAFDPSVQAMLKARHIERLRRRGQLCVVCEQAYGFYISLKTGERICEACNRAIDGAAK